MKKVLCVLCAIAICLSFTVISFAKEADVQVGSLTGISEQDLQKIYDAAEKIAEKLIARWDDIADESGALSLTEYIDKIADAVADKFGGIITGDIAKTIGDKVKEILVANGFNPDDIRVVESKNFDSLIDTIFAEIGEKYGENTVQALYNFICKSPIINWFANIYVDKPTEAPTTKAPETTTEAPEEPTDPTTVAPIDIPSTGDVSIFAGVAVLVVAAAAAVVCTKKAKKDEE